MKWSNVNSNDSEVVEQSLVVSKSCGASQETSDVTVQVGPAGVIKATKDSNTAIQNLASYMTNAASCGSTILLSKAGDSVAALYAGADVYQSDIGSYLLDFKKQFKAGSQTIQSCDSSSKRDNTIGVYIVNSLDDLEDIDHALQTWSKGGCLDSDGHDSIQSKTTMLGVSEVSKLSDISSSLEGFLAPRADCRTIEVKQGDGCASLATRCGISGDNFDKYNTGADFCKNLKVKQRVCCSAGSLPDIIPKKQSDGTCGTYTIQTNDNCAEIAAHFGVTQDDIYDLNEDT
ncbi:Peptidoglycan-binding Lysin subgroup [Penicillium freii]|nr:Peptidoglycan-binding Lysin subgroup [Penicillium freii]